MTTKNSKIDRLAEATDGRLHWNDPGMDDFETGWEDFPLGTRVEVITTNDIWRKGTVVETVRENERCIVVECDEKWHDHIEFYGGRGTTIMVYMNTRRGIISMIRKIDEPRREVVIPRRESSVIEGKCAELLKIAEIAVQHSGSRLRIAFNEENKTKKFIGNAARFLKLDGKRLGRDIELYGFMGDDVFGWEQVLVIFLREVLFPIKRELPESYAEAGEALRTLGDAVYPKNIIQKWRDLF